MGTKRFSPPRNLKPRNIEKVPEDKPILYKVLDRQGQNIYTGVSKRGQGQERLKDHLPAGSDSIPGGSAFQIKEMPSIDRARTEEKKIIKKEQPKHNKRP